MMLTIQIKPSPFKYAKWLFLCTLLRFVLWILMIVIYYNEKTGKEYYYNAADYYVRDHYEYIMAYDTFLSILVILACCILCLFFTGCAKRYIIFCYIQIIIAISMTVYSCLPLIAGVETNAVNFHQKQFFTAYLRYNLYYPSLFINYLICIYFFRKSARYHLENKKNDLFYRH